MKRAGLLLCVLALAVGPATSGAAGTSRNLPGTSCPAFPANSIWHADVSKLPVHSRSGQWKSHMSSSSRLHPDFGPAYGAQPVPYGIPITYVKSGHAKVGVGFDYAAESDNVRYPLGSDTKVEGGQWRSGDRHTVVVDVGTCRLYETWATRKRDGRWYAGSGATWDLRSNALRPAGWTSADAAGLPILPGLLRYDEVAAGRVDHAIRFTTPVTDRLYIWPARHQAGSRSDRAYPPMGARFRLKAGYPLTGLRADTKVVLRAMKTYGLMLADNGSAWYFQGTADTRWRNKTGMLDELKRIPASAFEAVDVSSLKVTAGSGRAG
jgi:hypothetical protein